MLLTCLLGAAILLGPAAKRGDAAEKGVHFNPGSPAGTEYALPLSQARNEAAGKTGVSKNGSVEPAPLFGEGVRGPGGPGAEGTARQRPGPGDARGPQARTGHGGGVTLGEAKARDSSRGPLLTTSAAHYPAGSGFLLGAVVILAGLGVGFGLRRLSGPRSA